MPRRSGFPGALLSAYGCWKRGVVTNVCRRDRRRRRTVSETPLDQNLYGQMDAGVRIGPYFVTALIGQGGMGEVWPHALTSRRAPLFR